MKICRFNHDRIGVVTDSGVVDVSDLFDLKPTWPLPPGDWVALQIPALLPRLAEALPGRQAVPLSSVRLEIPIANPSKVVGAPVNYRLHQAEAVADQGISGGREVPQIGVRGLFLKATTGLSGPADPVRLAFPDRRNDHEVELAVIIKKPAKNVKAADAMDYVLGYAIGLDMTVRGAEFPSFRKSPDTYAVLGPWMVTADEIPDPSNLRLSLKVNGETRQDASTKDMIFDVPTLIEYASAWYTLLPGDVIMTGTPEGVSEVQGGDVMDAAIEGVGDMRIKVEAAA